MSQSFNIAGPGSQSGIEALLGGASGSNQANAPDGLFSSMVNLLGSNNGPELSDLVQLGTPNNTGQAWMNLQLGDASLSLSSQALTTAINPEQLLGMVPGVVDSLHLDELALKGLNNLGEAVTAPIPAERAPTPLATLGNAALSLQEILQNHPANTQTAQNPTGQSQLVQEQISADLRALQTSNTPAAVTEQVAQKPANTLFGQPQNPGAPLTPEQIANQYASQNSPQNSPQNSLAAQLQRQLATQAEQQGTSPNAMATAQSAANTGAAQTNNFAATLSQLPFVQTREVVTMNDPLMVAQNAGQSASQTEQAGLFQPIKAAYQSPQINLPNMAVAITRNFNAGINRFQIRLDPAELGRVDVRLHVDESGVVNARLTVERPETLQLLQQDARALERALTQAGLEGSRANLEFFLKQDGSDEPQTDQDQNDHNSDGQDTTQSDLAPAITAYQGSISPGGVSLWV